MSETGCSAAGLAGFREQALLDIELSQSPGVARTRQLLIDAAIACDFETIAALAWTAAPENSHGWGTFWGETDYFGANLRDLDATQNALWDLAVALIATEPVWNFVECEGGGDAWYCDLAWYEWPATRGFDASAFSSDQLERLALLDGTTPELFTERLRHGYATFSVVISVDGQWMAAFAPSPGDCEAPPGSAIDHADEPDWRRDFPWTDTVGCRVRVDVLSEHIGPTADSTTPGYL